MRINWKWRLKKKPELQERPPPGWYTRWHADAIHLVDELYMPPQTMCGRVIASALSMHVTSVIDHVTCIACSNQMRTLS